MSGSSPLHLIGHESKLKEHVRNGCLCDPPSIAMNRSSQTSVISGEEFHRIRTQRGTSCLEGFHTHQKQWLGSLAQHASDAGQMLLSDGALRWNRKRNATLGATTLPTVFASKCLQSANDLHRRLRGENLYHNLPESDEHFADNNLAACDGELYQKLHGL